MAGGRLTRCARRPQGGLRHSALWSNAGGGPQFRNDEERRAALSPSAADGARQAAAARQAAGALSPNARSTAAVPQRVQSPRRACARQLSGGLGQGQAGQQRACPPRVSGRPGLCIPAGLSRYPCCGAGPQRWPTVGRAGACAARQTLQRVARRACAAPCQHGLPSARDMLTHAAQPRPRCSSPGPPGAGREARTRHAARSPPRARLEVAAASVPAASRYPQARGGCR
jgi:hypothetical protein